MNDDDPDLPEPRQPGTGCLLAVIVSAIGLLVVVYFAAQMLTEALGGVRIR